MCNCVHYEMTRIAVATFFMCHVCVMHWTQINTSRVTRWYINYSCYIQIPTSRFELNDKIKSDWNSSIKLIWTNTVWRCCSFSHREASQAVEDAPRVAGQALSVEVFKMWLYKALSDLLWARSWPCFELETSWGPFWPELSCDPGLGPGYAKHYAEGCYAVCNPLSQGCPGC